MFLFLCFRHQKDTYQLILPVELVVLDVVELVDVVEVLEVLEVLDDVVVDVVAG